MPRAEIINVFIIFAKSNATFCKLIASIEIHVHRVTHACLRVARCIDFSIDSRLSMILVCNSEIKN